MITPLPDAVLADRLLPLVDHPDPDVVVAAARAAEAAGAVCVEVALRHPGSLEALARVAASCSLVVGAGTVTTAGQVGAAVGSGAQFLVSPGSTPGLAAAVERAGTPWLPAAATPSEVLAARDAGASTVKLFPAASLGGPAFVRAVAAVAVGVRFVPTGGVGADLVADYLGIGPVAAVGGSWMFDLRAGSATDWRAVEAAVQAALAQTRSAAP